METSKIIISNRYDELISRFKNADSEAVRFMYKKFLPDVIAFITKIGGSEEDARDVFQEAIMALFKQAKANKLELRADLKTYLLAICKNQWFKSIRKNSKIDALIPDFDPSDLDQDLNKALEKAEQYRLIYSHIKKMTPSNQAILTMHLQKYSTEEIAKALNFSPAYVKKRKFISKRDLLVSIKKDQRFQELL